MGAYALTFDLNPGLQAKLITEFNQEKTSPEPASIEILTTCGSPSPATEAFLTQLLDDPKSQWTVVQSFGTRPASLHLPAPPLAALPKLADLLATEKDSERRQMLVRAVGKYGAQALPYLSEIEHLRDVESDPTTRRNLQAAADAIRAGKPLEH